MEFQWFYSSPGAQGYPWSLQRGSFPTFQPDVEGDRRQQCPMSREVLPTAAAGAVPAKAEPEQLGIEEGTKLEPGTISILLVAKSLGNNWGTGIFTFPPGAQVSPHCHLLPRCNFSFTLPLFFSALTLWVWGFVGKALPVLSGAISLSPCFLLSINTV